MGEEDFIDDKQPDQTDEEVLFTDDGEEVSVGGHWPWGEKDSDEPDLTEAGKKAFENLVVTFGNGLKKARESKYKTPEPKSYDGVKNSIEDLPFGDIEINKLTPKTEGHEEPLEDILKKQQSQTDNLEKAVLNIKEAQEAVRRDREEVEELFTQASATMEEAEEQWTSVKAKQQELKDLQAKLDAKAKDLEEREKALAVATENLIEREHNLEFKIRVLNPEKDKDEFSFVPGRLGRLGS